MSSLFLAGLMISSRQIRAARALIGVNQWQLAERAGIGIATLRRIEAATDEIIGSALTLTRIQRALEQSGVVFIDTDEKYGPGVRLRKRER
jgi:transcriptional regulator with XRE-family HTH domain